MAAYAPWEPPAGLQLQLIAATDLELLSVPVQDFRDFVPAGVVRTLGRLARDRASWQRRQLDAALRGRAVEGQRGAVGPPGCRRTARAGGGQRAPSDSLRPPERRAGLLPGSPTGALPP